MGNPGLRIESLTSKDIDNIPHIQPDDWPDILPSIQYYCISDFCFPLKATLDGTLAAIGTAIIHGKTAWLAHIIVNKGFRNSGIGTAITQSLIDLINRMPCQSILLIATALGEPVYKKLGFETQAEYLFLENGAFGDETFTKPILFEKKYENAVLKLDREVCGEDRNRLLHDHLALAHLYIENNTLKGFYIPTLGEGLIIADTTHAGFELMKTRCAAHKKFCLPINNQDGINFLINRGFKELRKGSRMILGKRFSWDGSKIYSRIGGNLG